MIIEENLDEDIWKPLKKGANRPMSARLLVQSENVGLLSIKHLAISQNSRNSNM